MAVSFVESIRDAFHDDPGRRTLFEHYLPEGSTERVPRYLGSADQDALTTDATWTIKRLSWSYNGVTNEIVDLQTLTGAWDSRAALAWRT